MFAYRSIFREQPRPAAVRDSHLSPWLAVGVVCFGAFMGQLDASIVTITFPSMQRDFGVPVAAVQWVSLAYLLGLIALLAAMLAALGLAGAAAFARREMRTEHPLIPVWLLRSAPLARALAGAACGYLTLFGPLVLIPQVLGHGLGGEARTGLLLSALPLGFGLAALFGDAVLPKAWDDSRRGFAGALLTCLVMCASIFLPVTVGTVIPQLALAGLGLGIFIPANNTVIMRSTADSSASLLGGLVSMARGIGTTLGISLMALALHLGAGHPGAGHGYAGSTQARPAFIVLAVVSAAAAAIALAARGPGRGEAGRLREADPSGAYH
jgi:MFS family permease